MFDPPGRHTSSKTPSHTCEPEKENRFVREYLRSRAATAAATAAPTRRVGFVAHGVATPMHSRAPTSLRSVDSEPLRTANARERRTNPHWGGDLEARHRRHHSITRRANSVDKRSIYAINLRQSPSYRPSLFVPEQSSRKGVKFVQCECKQTDLTHISGSHGGSKSVYKLEVTLLRRVARSA